MAGKITDAASITGANTAAGDLFELVDVSDTTLAATGTNKKITRDELAAALGLPRAWISVYLNAAQSIPDNVSGPYTYVSWTSVDENNGVTFTTGTSIPVPTGMTRVRAIANLNWAANNTGIRVGAWVRTNSGGTLQQYLSFEERGGVAETSMDAITPGWRTVAAGDLIKLGVYQNVGSALNLAGQSLTASGAAGLTYATVEFR